METRSVVSIDISFHMHDNEYYKNTQRSHSCKKMESMCFLPVMIKFSLHSRFLLYASDSKINFSTDWIHLPSQFQLRQLLKIYLRTKKLFRLEIKIFKYMWVTSAPAQKLTVTIQLEVQFFSNRLQKF